MAGRSCRSAAAKAREAITNGSDNMSRVRRDADSMSRATLSRDPPSSPSNQQSLRLTLKVPASKLREATGGASSRDAGRSTNVNSRGKFAGGEILESKRARNVKKSYVVESDSDEEDEDMDDLVDDDDDDDDDDAESAEEDDDVDVAEDAEGNEDGDGDIDMDVPPPPPIIKVSKTGKGRSSIAVKPMPAKKEVRLVEEKEMAAGSDDEELSELDSDIEEDDETMQIAGEEDVEGEDEEIEIEEDDEEEDELDSGDETPGGGSRASTPDLSKLTKRQRARLEEGGSGHLLALPDEVQVKKHLTAEEHAMRRAEMARRRKNLSEKRNEEEKMETINKLLKKQAPKTNARRRDFNGPGGAELTAEGEPVKPNPIYVRWVSNKDGNQIHVPTELIGGPVGAMFAKGGLSSGKMLEEVQ